MKKLSAPPVMSVTDRVFDSLYRAITCLELPPGTKMSEADVAERLGVSRQPVRDAFYRLSQRGYLEIRPQRATRVSRISVEQVLNAMFVRSALECACVEQIPALDADQITSLEAILKKQSQALNNNRDAEFNDLDESFHKRLCELAGRGHIWTLILEQKGHLDRVRWLTLATQRQAVLDEHYSILNALTAGQTYQAKSLLHSHTTKVRDSLYQVRNDNPALFA